MLRYLFLSLLTTLSYTQGMSQEKEPFNGYIGECDRLNIGMPVPDFHLAQVLNYKSRELALSDFRGKAILIDFWAAYCQPCLAQFPKLQRIQETYQKDLQIITITNDSLPQVIELFKRIEYKGFKLLTAAGGVANNPNDSLYFAFPHKYIPHYIWIDKSGVLKAITGHEALSPENIVLLVSGKSLTVANKQEDVSTTTNHPALYSYQEYDIAERMMLNDSIRGLIAYDMLTGYNKKYPPSSMIDQHGIYAGRRIRTWNLPLKTMLRMAYGKIGELTWEQEMVPAPRVFSNIRSNEILHKLTVNFLQAPDTTDDMYCYDLIVGKKGGQHLMDRMKEDLYRYFGVKGTMVKKKLACYILCLKDSNKLKTDGGDMYVKGNMYFLRLINAPFARLVDHIRSYNEGSKADPYHGLSSAIIVDEAGFTSNIDIDVTAGMNDIPALRRALNRYGLDLQEGERWVEVLLLQD